MADEFARDLILLYELYVSPETDARVKAIVCAAYIEDHITGLIREKMPGLTPVLTKKIFSETGPLGTIGNKIDAAQALCVIETKIAEDARLIARIRNRFAHEIRVDNFDHPRVKDLVDKLQSGRGLKVQHKDGRESPLDKDWDRSTRFIVGAMSVCGMIMQRHIKKFPYSFTAPMTKIGGKPPSPDKSATPAPKAAKARRPKGR
jgi:hypothetical protein